ncbi:MAG: hypothetical protein ACK40R_05770 [Thermomonas sp.]
MNAFLSLPPSFHWNARQLADAVPRRLSQMPLFDAAPDARMAGNDPRARPRMPAEYLPRQALAPAFRIH